MYKVILFLNYSYYAERAGLLEDELDLTEDRTKLHVNTKRPTHSDPDMIYTVIRFIDFTNTCLIKVEKKYTKNDLILESLW